MAQCGQVLHIYTHSGPATEEIEAQLADLGVNSHHSSDCYAGMASLVRCSPQAYDCVIISLESLTHSDEEFFQIVSRRYRPLPIYVYGTEAGEITTKWAIRVGARGRLDMATLKDIFTGVKTASDHTGDASEPFLPEPRLTDLLVDEIARPFEKQPAARDERKAETEPLETTKEFRAEDIGARREETRSIRQEPQARSTPQGPSAADRDNHAPLLSDEELQALLGDEPVLDEDADLKRKTEKGS